MQNSKYSNAFPHLFKPRLTTHSSLILKKQTVGFYADFFSLRKKGRFELSNTEARNKLLKKYGNKCFLTNVKLQKGTYHHIVKKELGGASNEENGAVLHKVIHQWLHNEIETKEKELYNLINECLILYKKCIDLKKYELIKQYEKEIVPLFYNEFINYSNKKKLVKKKRK